MLPEIFGLFALLMSGAAATSQIDAKLNAFASTYASLRAVAFPDLLPRAKFRPDERAVTNWRLEATGNLDLPPDSLTKLVASPDSPPVARCVKLNNYWCVKRAGWAGEIAADAEGHVAFASAIEGAIVAAVLLRRYYLDYHRRSAQAILARWAPAQCGSVGAASANRKVAPSARIGVSRARPLALRGLGNTLRARWLAAHRPAFGGAGKTVALRRSVVPDRPAPLMRAPEIAIGMGEVEIARTPIRIAALELALPAASAGGATCPGENQRIHNYALRAIEGIASDPEEDLKLFSPDGTPGANLPRLMRNMARVEIGPFGAREDLITAAVELATRRTPAGAAVAGAAQ